MGTHPIFESDFDCLTDIDKMEYSKQPPQAPGYNNAPMAGTNYDTQFTAPPQAPPGVQPTVPPSYAPQVAPAAAPGQQVIIQPVIVQQPAVNQFGTHPVMATCPHCGQTCLTKTEKETGLGTWLTCAGICIFGCWLGCCLIPFCVGDLQDTRHKCGHCGKTLHIKKMIS